jgi:hypothetical protein
MTSIVILQSIVIFLLMLFISIKDVKAQPVEYYKVPWVFNDGTFKQLPNTSKDWKKLEGIIQKSEATDIILKWQGVGGLVSMGNEFILMMAREQDKGKYFTFELNKNSDSMHAFVACQANDIIFTTGSSLFFHLFSNALNGHVSQSEVDKEMVIELIYNCKRKRLVTFEDIKELKEGKTIQIIKRQDGRIGKVIGEDSRIK